MSTRRDHALRAALSIRAHLHKSEQARERAVRRAVRSVAFDWDEHERAQLVREVTRLIHKAHAVCAVELEGILR